MWWLRVVALVQAADQFGERVRLAFVRGRGGSLDGASRGRLTGQVNHPGARTARRGSCHGRHPGLAGGGTCGAGDGGVADVPGFWGDDQQQVRAVLAGPIPDPAGQFGDRLPVRGPVRVVGHHDRADAQDAGGHLQFPGPDGLQPRAPGGVQRRGLSAGQAQQAHPGTGAAERVHQPAQLRRFLSGPARNGQDAGGRGERTGRGNPPWSPAMIDEIAAAATGLRIR